MNTNTHHESPTKTRFSNLGYIKDAPSLWRFVDLTDNSQARVGPQYKTKIELLCDLDRYATQIFGA